MKCNTPYPWLMTVSYVPRREVASKSNHGQRKGRAQQNSQNQAHVLAHIADVVPVCVTLRVRGIRLPRRTRHQRKPNDGPA